jgi:hypothetical protein
MTEPYTPHLGDKVEVYLTAKGRPEKHADRLVGEVTGIGTDGRVGQCRVKVPAQWGGHVHNWYWFEQVRAA